MPGCVLNPLAGAHVRPSQEIGNVTCSMAASSPPRYFSASSGLARLPNRPPPPTRTHLPVRPRHPASRPAKGPRNAPPPRPQRSVRPRGPAPTHRRVSPGTRITPAPDPPHNRQTRASMARAPPARAAWNKIRQLLRRHPVRPTGGNGFASEKKPGVHPAIPAAQGSRDSTKKSLWFFSSEKNAFTF